MLGRTRRAQKAENCIRARENVEGMVDCGQWLCDKIKLSQELESLKHNPATALWLGSGVFIFLDSGSFGLGSRCIQMCGQSGNTRARSMVESGLCVPMKDFTNIYRRLPN